MPCLLVGNKGVWEGACLAGLSTSCDLHLLLAVVPGYYLHLVVQLGVLTVVLLRSVVVVLMM